MIDIQEHLAATKRAEESRWPQDREVYNKLPSVLQARPYIPPMGFRDIKDFYEQALRRAFGGLRPEVVDYEMRMCATKIKTDGVVEEKVWPRWYALIEVDEWPREPEIVLTRAQKFLRWITRNPLPPTKEPTRVQHYWDFGDLQFKILRDLYQRGELDGNG